MKSLNVLCLVIMINVVNAQTVLPLWPDGVPNSIKSTVAEKTVIENSMHISQVTNPTIEVYLPAKAHSLKTAVLICPGGGYALLSYDKEGTDMAKFLNGHGIAGIVLKNRLPDEATNEIPDKSPLMDAKRAMEIIREHAAEWNIDPTKIGVMGFSAGGHLASTLGTHFDAQNKPNFMALIYPVVTMKSDYTHGGSRKNLIGEKPTEEMIRFYSNELQVSADTPPTFIVHSMDDKTVPVENSLQMAKALNDKGIPTEMHIYPKGGHGYSLAINQKRLSEWPELLVKWIRDLE